MNKKTMLLGACLLMGAGTASAQRSVTGRVTDSHGEPVFGATVRVAGTKVHAQTDAEGRFTLNGVPASAKQITISYIGLKPKTISVAGNVQVVLEDANRLDEAVVVGYGSAKKLGTVVGSVKKVSSDIVEGKPDVNVADALQGQVAGMSVLNSSGDVGSVGNVSISIRGIGSISASSTPLIVVDGTPVATAMLSMLNSADIESITTLKDASATSIYGSRAANGVLYITTKKGRRGEQAVVTVSQKIGWSQLARELGNPMSADELLDFQLENGIIYPQNYAEYKAHGANTNWEDYMFRRDAPMYSTEASIRGGSENTSYFVSASYLKQQGVTTYSDFKRYTLRTNIDSKVNDWLSMGINHSIAYTERAADGFTRNGTANIYSASSTATAFPAYWDPFDPSSLTTHTIWGSSLIDPLWLRGVQLAQNNEIVYNGMGYIQITPARGLTLRSQLGLYAVDSRASGKLLPSAAPVIMGAADALGDHQESFGRSSLWTITNTAEYKWDINDDNSLTLLAGQEGIKGDTYSFEASVDGIADDRLTMLSHGTIPKLPSDSKSKYEYLSFFGRADYALKNKYFANVTVRSDASSRFGSANRTAIFVSGGLMWDMKRELFLQPLTWLSALQAKASVGSTGNSEIGNYGHIGLAGSTRYDGETGFGFAQYSNPDLGWEKQIQTNLGFNATIMDRLHVDFNFYNRKTKNMLMNTPLPYTTGISSVMTNVGEMTNRGVEVEVSWDVVRTKDVSLNIRATYAYNTNTVDKLFYDLDEWPMKNSLLSLIKGKSINFYMPIYAGVDKEDGAPMWYKKGYKGEAGHTFNPETMTKDASQIENLYQDTGKKYYAPHNGGFGLTATWKGLTLSADFSFVLGKYMVNNEYFLNTSSSSAAAGYNLDRDALNMWKKPGDLTDLPAFKYDSQFDTHLLENASFMRLKNLSLSYDVPLRWHELTHCIRNVRLNFTARNVFTVTKYRGSDPEVNANLSMGNYPALRQFTLGVDVTF